MSSTFSIQRLQLRISVDGALLSSTAPQSQSDAHSTHNSIQSLYRTKPVKSPERETGLSSVLRPRQHSIGYMGDGFYRSKDPTNSIKVLKEKAVKENNPKTHKENTNYTYA